METSLAQPGSLTKEKRFANQIDRTLPIERRPLPKQNPFGENSDIQKVKQIRSSFETSSSTKKAEFTKDTLLFFQNIGIIMEKVDPVPLGVGANHAVYRYASPDGSERVIKLMRPGGQLSSMNKGVSEEENIKEVQHYFGPYFPKTEYKEDKKVGITCQIQDIVEGETITDKNYTLGIKKQLQEIATMNKKAYEEKNIALDFVGMQGMMRWLRKQASKLILHQGTAEIANVLVDKQGQVKIIDTDFYRFNDPRQSFKEKIFARVANKFTHIFLKHYFDVSV